MPTTGWAVVRQPVVGRRAWRALSKVSEIGMLNDGCVVVVTRETVRWWHCRCCATSSQTRLRLYSEMRWSHRKRALQTCNLRLKCPTQQTHHKTSETRGLGGVVSCSCHHALHHKCLACLFKRNTPLPHEEHATVHVCETLREPDTWP